MFINNRNTWWLWSTCLVLISFVCAYPRDHGERQVNLKIGFDLTQEVNGEPALRIRDFEDHDNYPRAVESSEKQKHHAIRADSFSASDEEVKEVAEVKEVKEVKKPKKIKRERERNKSSKEGSDSDSDEDSNERKVRSTQGIRAGELDAEDGNVKVHGREPDDSDAR